MAERAHQTRAGAHFYAILLRKRDTALQTRNAVAHRNGIVQGPERIHTHIQTTFSQPAAGLVGETTAQDHYFIPDTQGHGTLPFRNGCLPFHHHSAKISFFHKISIRFRLKLVNCASKTRYYMKKFIYLSLIMILALACRKEDEDTSNYYNPDGSLLTWEQARDLTEDLWSMFDFVVISKDILSPSTRINQSFADQF